jgi:hypothetical protein
MLRWGRDLNPWGENTSGFRDHRRGPGLATPAKENTCYFMLQNLNETFFYMGIDYFGSNNKRTAKETN